MIEVTNETILEFTKLLIECGDVYEVQPDYTIKNRRTGELVQVIKSKEPKPLMIFHEGASSNLDVVWLNPFKETLGVSREREWFFGAISAVGGALTKYITRKLIEDGVKKADDNYNQFALMSKIADKVDETMLTEIDKLSANMFISIFYNKREKMACAQTELFSKELHDSFPKFRKKTWEVFETIFLEIFGSEDLSEYKYRAKLINIPETEAKLKVAVAIITQLGPFAKDFLGRDLHEQELNQHLEVLEGYSRLYAWAPVNNDTSNKFQQQTTTVPWNMSQQPMSGFVPMQPAYAASVPTVPNSGGSIPMSKYAGIGVPVTNDMYASVNPYAVNPNIPATACGLFGVK